MVFSQKETYLSFSRVYNVFTHTHKHDSLIVNCKTSKTYSKLVLETIEYNLTFLRTRHIYCEGQVMSDFHMYIWQSIHCISDKRPKEYVAVQIDLREFNRLQNPAWHSPELEVMLDVER